ncbi:hypothetical protein N7491_005964 [Penicillium cf. griseofulvum]|uniref:Uncharacterized protein n=1 Tax=Penicillium cf. griseofulvum TaxID=2972120 RepID=A0A9W9J437_9EURO|nr:hypothetical protein N7472_008647 [Penicillium cf. griseofulvum]KAJ5435369.1 hypothetical protein N7491_005964 [Penicillium cf. griseofulvum]KAJ5453201.1 hypothetical protein N7445_001384 [Penicillium cf. griseofulvum]
MHLYKALILVFAHLTLSSQYFNNTYINHNLLTTPSSKTEAAACPAGGCGSAPACVLTETCSTATFTSPSTTTITTCVPTPTCAGVYSPDHPVSSEPRTTNAVRATALLTNVDRRMMTGHHVKRTVGSALSMNTAVMGILA